MTELRLAPLAGTLLIALASFSVSVHAQSASAFGCKDLETNPELPAIEGKDGFFFRIPNDLGMQYPMSDQIISRMEELADALKKKGTTLVYVPVPPKSLVLSASLPDQARLYGFDPQVALQVYADQVQRLNERGVLTVDVAAAMRANDDPNLFFKSDFLWTPQGARVAADAIAAAIKKQPEYKSGGERRFVTEVAERTSVPSDMRRALQLRCEKSLPQNVIELHRIVSADGDRAVGAEGDNTKSDSIVVVGTSFSAAPAGNFTGFLSEFSNLPVSNRAIADTDQFGAIISYLTSIEFSEDRPRFLIWENPIYNDLAIYGEAPFVELIAAAAGSCRPAIVDTRPGRGKNDLVVDLSQFPLDPGDIVFAKDAGARARSFSLELHRKDGQVRTASVTRNERLPATGRFFVSVEPLWSDDLAKMVVRFAEPATEGGGVEICEVGK
jgi:alginate biosynthesis protein AlgX